MGQTERLYQLKNWLDSGRCLVVFEKERRGWKLDPSVQLGGTQYELPGLWLSSDAMQALFTMQHLLANLDTGGLLGPHERVRFPQSLGCDQILGEWIGMPIPADPCALLIRSRQTSPAKSHRNPATQARRAAPRANTAARSAKASQ